MNLLQREWKQISAGSLAHNAGWMLAGQGAGLILQVAYFIVLGRLLGSKQYGIFVGAMALTSIISNYSAMGSGTLLLRYVSSDYGKFAAYWGNVLLTTTTVSAVLIAAADLAAPHLLNSSSAVLVPIVAVANCFCGVLTTNAATVFQAFEKMKTTAVLNFATNLTRFCAAAGMFVLLHHAVALQWAIVSLVVSALAALVSMIVVTRRYGWPTFSARLMIRRIPEGFGYSFAWSTTSIYNDIDKTMLSHYGMNVANGVYSLAYRVIDVAAMPMAAIRAAAIPKFFRAGDSSRQEAKLLCFRLMARAVAVSVLVSAGIYCAAPLIPRIAGPSFAESVAAVRWLSLIPVLRSIHVMAGGAIFGMGKQSYRTILQSFAAILNFALNLWCIPAFGWRGAAATSLFTDSMLSVLSVVLLLYLCRSTDSSET